MRDEEYYLSGTCVPFGKLPFFFFKLVFINYQYSYFSVYFFLAVCHIHTQTRRNVFLVCLSQLSTIFTSLSLSFSLSHTHTHTHTHLHTYQHEHHRLIWQLIKVILPKHTNACVINEGNDHSRIKCIRKSRFF